MGISTRDVVIPVGNRSLGGELALPDRAVGIVIFAHGSGSSRFSPRNQFVARSLNEAGFATLLMDLLEEAEADDRRNVFDVDLLADRLAAAVDWVGTEDVLRNLPIGLFGASTGSAAALAAASRRPEAVRAVVSRGGRPDLAWKSLPEVYVPTLLIVGEYDAEVLQLNRSAARRLGGLHEIRIVPRATHLFEEPGALHEVAAMAKGWFVTHLASRGPVQEACPSMFADRADAGRHLANRLRGRSFTDPVVLAIPRGGIVAAAILANSLNADLDVILARKLRMPDNPEYALGAISETGDVFLNAEARELPPSLQAYLEKECQHQKAEIARRQSVFRPGREPLTLSGRSVLVVDDGIATGATMIAALRAIRMQNPLELIVAVPVAAPDRLRQVERECDEAVCLIVAPELHAVGEYYEDFAQIEDEEVVRTLSRFARRMPSLASSGT